LIFGAHLLSAWFLVLPAVLFLVLVIRHDRVSRRRELAERAVAFYERGLARLENRWAGSGQPGTRFLDDHHPYAPDLDLFGSASLFELLCTARTRRGEDTLAAWLLGPAPPDEIRSRQVAVRELRPRLDLREDVGLLGADVPAGVDLDAVAAWGAAPAVSFPRWERRLATLLGALAMITLVGWLLADLTAWPLLVVLLLESLFALRIRGRVQQVIKPVEKRAHDLALLAGLLARMEREPLAAPGLCRLRAALDSSGVPPSRRIAQLGRLLDWLNARHNQLFAPFAIILLWGTQMAFAIEAWRGAAGRAIARWLAAVGDFESLCALASYSYENPADHFPEIVDAGPCFDGEGLGHPLLPLQRCVRNDLRLGDTGRLVIVSGSNMSGKSTLLRTVGINTVLALAGAPVRAHRLRISPLMVGATLRIQDSLQAGRSRFYAEIQRVRQLLDLARGSPPLLFLLDELLQGTNSHDRRLGAEAVVRTLVDLGAIGLITTHDLALTQIADLLAPRAANIHFEDELHDGSMTFDYRIRPGVVRKSNALALMRAVGIDV
jgi:hypothetical protein